MADQSITEAEDSEHEEELLEAELESAVIDVRDAPGHHTIILEGEVDIASAPRLHERLNNAFEEQARGITVDLRDISFIDSTGLGTLVSARQRALNSTVEFKLLLPEGKARFPFEITGLASIFDKKA